MPSPSFACAKFISTAATIGANHKPNSHKTNGIYAEVLFAQGTAHSSYSLVISTMRIFKYSSNVSLWLHALGTTLLAITILAAAPKHQSGKFVFPTFVDGTSVGGVGWLQRASPAYVVVFGILLAPYALTARKEYVAQSPSVFSSTFRIRCKRTYD